MIFLEKPFSKTKPTLFLFLLAEIFLLSNFAFADWQSTLQKNFDIVETFDQLQDWTGTQLNGYSATVSDLPRLLNGNASIWGKYSCYNAKSTSGNWIGDHTGDNEWVSGNANDAKYHKSLCLDYDNNILDRVAKGPSRIITYFGEGSPTSGYTDIYVFMMVKISSAFYPAKVDGSYPYSGYHKFLHMSTGFRDIDNWGTTAQQALCERIQCGKIYGLNYTILHTWTGARADDPVFEEAVKFSNPGGTEKIEGLKAITDASIEKYVDANQWFGIEIHFHLGTLEKSDGYAKFWVYDQNGNKTSSYQTSNSKHLAKYDHKYNLLNIGGNRYDSGYATATAAHYYVDDLIINNSQIGPKYFSLLGMPIASNSSSTASSFENIVSIFTETPSKVTGVRIVE